MFTERTSMATTEQIKRVENKEGLYSPRSHTQLTSPHFSTFLCETEDIFSLKQIGLGHISYAVFKKMCQWKYLHLSHKNTFTVKSPREK